MSSVASTGAFGRAVRRSFSMSRGLCLVWLVVGLGCTGNGHAGASGTGGAAASGGSGGSSNGMTGGSGGATGGTGGTAGGVAPSASVLERNNHPSRDGHFLQPSLTRAAAATMALDASFNAAYTGAVLGSPLYFDGGAGGRGIFIAVTSGN